MPPPDDASAVAVLSAMTQALTTRPAPLLAMPPPLPATLPCRIVSPSSVTLAAELLKHRQALLPSMTTAWAATSRSDSSVMPAAKPP